MTLVPLSLSNQSAPARYKQGGAARLLNCYVEKVGEEGKTPWQVHASDGLQGYADFSTLGIAGGIRALLTVGTQLYAVVGVSLCRVETNGTTTLIGSMNISTTAPVYMARNRRATPDIMIVCDGLAYYYRTTFQQVTDADLLAPTSLAFCNGYFIIGTANNTWQVGDLDDAANWNSLKSARADANPDAVVRVAALQKYAVIFGELSTELWSDRGVNTQPFEFVLSIDLGCLAANSVATVEQTLAWVASDRTVRMLKGSVAERISSHSVERAIESVVDRSTIRATSWVNNGHTFYAVTSSDWTWVYDTVTGLWHERASYGQNNWFVSCIETFDGKLIAGDATDPKLYEMSASFADEAGDPLVMSTTLPPVHTFPDPITVYAVYIDCERGVGTGQGASQDIDPQLMLEVSRDGGNTFTAQRMIRIGEQGERVLRVKAHRFGMSGSDGFTFKVSCSAKVARALYGMSAEVEKAR